MEIFLISLSKFTLSKLSNTISDPFFYFYFTFPSRSCLQSTPPPPPSIITAFAHLNKDNSINNLPAMLPANPDNTFSPGLCFALLTQILRPTLSNLPL